MAGHAPELQSAGERLRSWISEASDLRLSIYMFLLALTVAALLYFVDSRFFA